MAQRPASTIMSLPGGRAHGGGVLVIDADGVPGWVVDWCRASGRALWRVRLPELPGGDLGAAADQAATIGDLAATATRAGDAVLVARSAPARAGKPRVVAALRELPDDATVLATAAESATQMGGELMAAHAVPTSFGERSVGLQAALDHGRQVLDAAAATPSVQPLLLRIWPYELVGEGLDADLLVVGGPRHHGGLGLVARSALHHAPCPVLLVPRTPDPAHRRGEP